MATKTTKKTTKTPTRKKATSAAKKATKPAKKAAKKSSKTAVKKTRTVKPTGPNLVIVESPAKARTIGRYLGSDYEVRASMGHVRDLPVRGAGVIINDEGFHPKYEVIPDKVKVVKELLKLSKRAPIVYLATDLDREGEAIAWHLVEALEVPEERQKRVTFHEITKKAIVEAFSKPGELNQPRVDAQQARRILDRVVGYPLSRLLSKSISRGMSAGRVQSVSVRLITDREKEVRAFNSVDYWRLFADVRAPGAPTEEAFTTDLISVDGLTLAELDDAHSSEGSEEEMIAESRGRKQKKTRELRLPSAAIAEKLVSEIRAGQFKVDGIDAKRRMEWAPPPFITSTLQQQGSIRLRWSTKRTMQIAQSLYEGVALGAEGPTGLITYMRTDSVSLGAEAVADCRAFIAQKFGDAYLPDQPRVFKSGKGAQEAHEAIRPTDPARTPDSIRSVLGEEEYKLYKMIWERFVACQMSAAQVDTTALKVRSGSAVFEARGRIVAFPGWRAVSPGKSNKDQPSLPNVKEGDILDLDELRSEQRTTQPPPRYSEATLVKRLEKEGIGRPSTYADIIAKIQARKYVTKEAGRFHASELGEVMVDRMVPFFPGIMEPSFTRKLEADLDAVEAGTENWQTLLKRFYAKFEKELDEANEGMPKLKFLPAEGEDPCEECGKPVVIRFSSGRKFFGCSGYPECKYTRGGDNTARPKPIPTDHVCEKCEKGMVIRTGRRGQFLSCSGYPACKNAKNIAEDGSIIEPKKSGEDCEKCGAEMVIKTGRRGEFLACSAFPKCRNARDVGSKPSADGKETPGAPVALAPLPDCPKCGAAMNLRRSGRGSFCGCTKYPECKGTAPVPAGALPPRAPLKDAGVNCPACDKPMKIRTSRRGEFAGCSGYPKCRETKTMEEVLKETGSPAAAGATPEATSEASPDA